MTSYQTTPSVEQLDAVIPRQHSYYGDASLRPNTGLTNSYDYALFGLALHQLLDRLRLSIIGCASLAVFLNGLFFWLQGFHFISMFLSVLVALLALILVVVEITSFWNTTAENLILNETSNDNPVSTRERLAQIAGILEKIGTILLYHPLGKAGYLLLLGLLSIRTNGFWDTVIGFWFLGNMGLLLYCWCTYPEFRLTFQASGDDKSFLSTPTTAATQSWSVYSERKALLPDDLESS